MDDLKIQECVDWAKNLIGGEVAVQREPHGDEGVVYELGTEKGRYFLKIKEGSGYEKERERLAWLENKLPVPKVVGFVEKDGAEALLLTAIEGKNLKVLSQEWSPEKVIEKLVEALHRFHATDTSEWAFGTPTPNKVLVHGDACLPNFIFKGDVFSGYIDLGEVALGTPEIDLAAAIWSLQFNLGKGYGAKFLQQYGYPDTSEETVERLRLEYETFQQAHGFLLDA